MLARSRVAKLLRTEVPIVQAPMAGGFTTPELVAAVSNAGALGSLAAAYLSLDETREAIRSIRRLTERPFAVNLFAPLPQATADDDAVAAMNGVLRPFREELGLPEPGALPPLPGPSHVEEQIALLAEEHVQVFSFTLGTVPFEPVKEAGSVVLATATTVAEAAELERLGVDVIVAQSGEAGGHRGTFLGPFENGVVGGIALVPRIVDQVSVPVLLAGGIMDGRGIAAAFALGAEGVQLGTAFLSCSESGAPAAYRRALAAAADTTVVTPAFSGRHARAIRTRLADAIASSGVELLPFPLQAVVWVDIRAAAIEADRADLLFVLAGQGADMGRELTAKELVQALLRETESAVDALARDR